MDTKVIGVDYSGNAISMVVLTYGKGEYRVVACEQAFFADNEDWGDVAEAIARIREEVDLRDAACIAAIPDDWVSHRTVTMPFADRKKISKIIRYEIEPLLPFPVDGLIVDFQPLMGSRASDSGTDFFTAVVSKTRLKDYIDKLNALGLEPEAITTRGFAAACALSAFRQDGLFVDGDDRHMIACCFAEGKVRSVYSLPLGRQNGDPSRALVEALKYVLITDEEKYQDAFKPEAVYLADALYQHEGVSEVIASSLGLKTMKMEAAGLANLPALPDRGKDQSPACGFDIALCLALLKRVNKPLINFRKDEFAITGKWRQYSDIIIRTGLIAAMVIVIGLSGLFYDLKSYREQIASIYAQRVEIFKESFPEVPLIDDPLVQMRAESGRLKGKIGLPPEMGRKAYCIDILNDISRFVPSGSDVVVERLVVGSDDVILSGTTDSFNSVDALKSEFGKSELFDKIDISTATMSKIDKRVSFKLRLELR